LPFLQYNANIESKHIFFLQKVVWTFVSNFCKSRQNCRQNFILKEFLKIHALISHFATQAGVLEILAE